MLIFRPRELNLADADAVSHEEEHIRQAILGQLQSGAFAALVVPAAALLQRLITPEQFRARTLTLKVGDRQDPAALAQTLLRHGFERLRLVEGPGQFAVRGDILDIGLPVTDNRDDCLGIRLSFFDDEMDAIKTFDPESQRSRSMLTTAVIPPMREILPDEAQHPAIAEAMVQIAAKTFRERLEDGASREAAEAARQLAAHDLDRFRQHLAFAGIDRCWLCLPRRKQPFSTTPGLPAACFSSTNRCAGATAGRGPGRFRRTLPHDARQRPGPAHNGQSPLRGADAACWWIGRGQTAAFSPWPRCRLWQRSANALHFDVNGRPADGYRGREEKLANDCLEFSRSGFGRSFLPAQPAAVSVCANFSGKDQVVDVDEAHCARVSSGRPPDWH